jgi:DNA-directed RNA polymerase alpha subunit
MFSHDEVQVFYNEGWLITNDLQLQRLDEDARLSDDHAAWKLVWNQATAGSIPHMKALAFLHQFAPEEYAAILATVQTH